MIFILFALENSEVLYVAIDSPEVPHWWTGDQDAWTPLRSAFNLTCRKQRDDPKHTLEALENTP